MPRWRKGETTIERLLQARHLERVPADPDVPSALTAAANRHVASARACATTDPEGSYALAYDAARKTATALLSHQGLRPTSAGGHIAVVEAIQAQFPDVPGLRSLDRMRRRRNQAEYPDPAGYDAPEGGSRPVRWQEEMQGPQSRLYSALTEVCADVLGVAALAPWRSGFLLLLPAIDPEGDFDVSRHLFERFRAAGEQIRPGLRLYFCLGSAVASPGGFGQSLEESERALAVARTLDITDRPLAFEHLGVYRVLLGPNSARDRRDFVDEALGDVVRYDVEHGTNLVATLRTWVDADYNVTEAAQRMYVHNNTLKYRLKRVRALLGGDPSRGDLRLQVELALKMLDIPRLAATTTVVAE